MRYRDKDSNDGRPMPAPWLAGAAIGLTILTLASGAIVLGASLALGQAARPEK